MTEPMISDSDAQTLLDQVAHLVTDGTTILSVSSAVEPELGIEADRLIGRRLSSLGEPTGSGTVDRLSAGIGVDLRLGDDFDGGVIRLRHLGDVGGRTHVEVRSLSEFIVSQDELTGLPLRAATLSHLRRCLQVAGEGSETAVVYCNVDGVKKINDRLGHEAGDELLAEVARRLRSVVRSADLVGRVGDDEFVVISPGIAESHEADDFARRVFEAVTGPVTCAGVQVGASMSAGVTDSDDADRSASSLLKKARLAMEEAKRAGRGRLERFRPELAVDEADRAHREAQLVDAIDEGQFLMHFQQLVSADSGTDRPIGVEALARWQHPTEGLVLPDRFLGLAEDTGFITTLGTHLIRLAVADFVTWPGTAPQFLAVNMSPQQLDAPGAAGEVLEILEAADLDADKLVVELTEGAFAKGQAVLDNLTTLRGAGVRIFLDDFGTGYSSLSYLRRFPVDGIKIDRSFLHPTLDRGLVRIIVDIASTMDVVTVAEGIETQEALEQVAELGVTYAQGFLIDMPGPAASLSAAVPAS